jgi:hypothetical protein
LCWARWCRGCWLIWSRAIRHAWITPMPRAPCCGTANARLGSRTAQRVIQDTAWRIAHVSADLRGYGAHQSRPVPLRAVNGETAALYARGDRNRGRSSSTSGPVPLYCCRCATSPCGDGLLAGISHSNAQHTDYYLEELSTAPEPHWSGRQRNRT